MRTSPDKQHILDSLAAIARGAGRAPSRSEFVSLSGISEHRVTQIFPSWNAAVKAAGLQPNNLNVRLHDRELLEDWGCAVRRNRAIPTRRAFRHLGKFDHRTMERRFGPWSTLPKVFRNFAKDTPERADVLALLPASSPKPSRNPVRTSRQVSLASTLSAKVCHSPLKHRPTCGGPMDFRGLRHEPVNEQGVVLLFGLVAKELGYIVETVQSGFPDCEAKRKIASQRWQRVHIEFEFESRNFRDHGHPIDGCDVIVCWRHNWPDHPPQIEILELSSQIKSLPTSSD